MTLKSLRLWPAVLAVVVLWASRLGVKTAVDGFPGFALAMQGAIICALLIVIWWAFFSRAPLGERWGTLAVMALGLLFTWLLRHGSMGPLWMLGYAVPVLCTVLVLSAIATHRLPSRARRAWMAGVILLACGVWLLARTDGIDGDHDARFAWRWAATPEERLLAAPAGELAPAARPVEMPAAPPAVATAKPDPAPVTPAPLSPAAAMLVGDWPGFRGPNRDGIVRGARIATVWSRTPPVEVWRRPIGPGWSSFAVRGGLLYTQEQRGEDEVVACYRVATGQPVWAHRDRTRFFESNAGAGPRATPTVNAQRVYALGATGILNALDAATGAVAWSRNVTADSAAPVPYWGFSSSPVVTDGQVIVAAAGQLLAYDAATGEPRWSGPEGDGYSSPHLATIGGVPQILHVRDAGIIGVAPADGTVLWQHSWSGTPIVQPAITRDGDVLLVAGAASGTRRVHIARGPEGWRVEERWTSNGLKPYFNDFIVHEGHAYGFDARILAAIDLATGERKWKGGRYGNGQLLLLEDQRVLLVLSEDGELVLVSASPDAFTELGRFKAIEGKTWNHPVLVGDLVLVRNSEEMAAFRVAQPAESGVKPRDAGR